MMKIIYVMSLLGCSVQVMDVFSSYHRKIGKLVHLRYLEIGIPRLPLSDISRPTTISNLKNLETLIIDTWYFVTLPHCIRGMVTLRHLYVLDSASKCLDNEPLRILQNQSAKSQ